MFQKTHIVNASKKPGKQKADPHNISDVSAQKIASLVLQMIQKLPKGQENPARGMQNEIVGDAGLAYNTKSKKNGGTTVGGL